MTTDSSCRLCRDSHAVLEKSHVLPSFVYRWMKASGGRFLRTAVVPNRRVQDGAKRRWLCRKCETRFNSYETWFAKQVFHPFLQSAKPMAVRYTDELYRFALSVLWRCLLGAFEADAIFCRAPTVNREPA